MANVIVNLPLPVGNGPGAAVDVSGMGRNKTIVATGSYQGATITVEISEEVGGAGAYAPLVTFQSGDGKQTIPVAARFMRVNVANRKSTVPFSAVVEVGSDDIGTTFAVLTLPAGNGPGPSANISALGEFTTVVCGGSFPGAAVAIEVSDDGTNFAPLTTFASYGGYFSSLVTANWARVNVSGRSSKVPFSSTVAIGAIVDPTAPPPQVPIPGGSTCYIYQPGGGQTGPGTFDTWSALMTALGVARAQANGSGCYTIQFDDSFASPATIPAGAYNMTNVTWEGTDKVVQVAIADGASFTKLRMFAGPLAIVNNNATTAACSDLANGDVIVVRDTGLSTVDAGAAFYDGTALAPGQTVTAYFVEAANVGANDDGPVFSFPSPGTQLNFSMDGDSFIANPLAFVGGGTSTLQVKTDGMVQVPTVFTNWTGIIGEPALNVPASLVPRPYLAAASAAAFSGSFGQWLRFNASGAPIAETLPSINAAPNSISGPGCFLFVTEQGGGTLTITPAAGDTLQGSAAAHTVPPNGGTLLCSDGKSDWRIAGEFAGSGVLGGGESQCLIFRPGSTATGPVIFNAWADLMTRLTALRAAANAGGCYTIQFDASITTPVVIPAGGPYNMTDVTWEGTLTGFGTPLQIANGASFTGLRRFTGALNVRNLNTVTPAVSDLASGDFVIIERSASLDTVAGGAAFFDATTAGAGAFIIVEIFESGTIGFSDAGPVFNIPGAGAELFLTMEGASSITNAAVLVGGATAVLQQNVSSLEGLHTVFANWAGTVASPRLDVPPSLVPVPYLGSPSTTTSTSSSFGQWRRKNATGATSQTLPKISTATGSLSGPGCFILISEAGGGNVLTVTAAAGDTIQGGAAAGSVNCPAGGALLLISDGVSNWTIVAQYGSKRLSPPEKWNQQNVAKSQTNVALSTLVSTNFDDIKMIRAGSIVGLGSRFSTAVTAGTATVKVSVNGATTGTLTVVSTNASNASGGQSTQQAGIDRFVAGDEVSILITTDGSFAPDGGTNLEAWLEIEEVP